MNDIRIKPNEANIQFSGSAGGLLSLRANNDGILFFSGSTNALAISGSGEVKFYKDVHFNVHTGSISSLAAFDSDGKLIKSDASNFNANLKWKQIAFGNSLNSITSSAKLSWDDISNYLNLSGSVKFNNDYGVIRDKWGNWQWGFSPSDSGSNNGEIYIGAQSALPGLKQNAIYLYTNDLIQLALSGSTIRIFNRAENNSVSSSLLGVDSDNKVFYTSTSSFAKKSPYTKTMGFQASTDSIYIEPGIKAKYHIAYNSIINKVRAIANSTGSIHVKLQKNNSTVGDIILNNEYSYYNNSLTTWNRILNEDDLLYFTIMSSSIDITNISIFIDIQNR